MKIKNTHLLYELCNEYPQQYSQFKKLLLTQKAEECSHNVHLGFEMNNLNKEISNVAPILKNDKLLLFSNFPENNVIEFSKEDVDTINVKIHYRFEDNNCYWEWEFKNGELSFVPHWSDNISIYFQLQFCTALSQIYDTEVRWQDVSYFLTLMVLHKIFPIVVFLQFSNDKIKLQEIKPHSKKNYLISNETNLTIIRVDSLWDTKSISVGEYKVRGHFRLQKCGKAYSEVKLIYIDEFKKKQYIRRSTREMVYS